MALTVRAARPQDRTPWCELSGSGGADLEAAWWDAHYDDPSWRLLIAENGRLLGKTAARLVPGVGVEVAPPRVRKGAPVASVASALLESALAFRMEGPYPTFQFTVRDTLPDSDALRDAARAAGFDVAEERVIVERDLTTLERSPPMPFACRTLDEMEDDAFLPVYARATGRTEEEAGPAWQRLKRLPGFDPHWAFLATKNGEPLGFVVTNVYPHDPTGGTITSIGLLPERRGKGHGANLHRYALDALRRRGAQRYRNGANVDDDRMMGLFKDTECAPVAREWVYRKAVN